MAYRTRKTSSRSSGRSKKTQTQQLTTLARQMGQIERGLKNPDSRISQSYNQGKNPKQRKSRTLF